VDAATALRFEEHLHACPNCTKALGEQRILQTALKGDALFYRAPEHLHQRVRASLTGQTRRPAKRLPWRALVAAACLLFCVGLGALLGRVNFTGSAPERLLQEVTASHIRSLQWNHLIDVHSSDQHVVKPWFTGKLDFSPSVRIPAPEEFPFVGGRLDYLDGRQVAALVYKRREHVINVFMWPASSTQDIAPQGETRQGYQLIYWSKAGMNVWVVSDLNETELNEFARRLQE
jgi:anti-sigma factor RsiW